MDKNTGLHPVLNQVPALELDCGAGYDLLKNKSTQLEYAEMVQPTLLPDCPELAIEGLAQALRPFFIFRSWAVGHWRAVPAIHDQLGWSLAHYKPSLVVSLCPPVRGSSSEAC